MAKGEENQPGAALAKGRVEVELPAHHKRWVRSALVLAVVAYALLSIKNFALGHPINGAELLALVVCCVALVVSRYRVKGAGFLGIAVVWTQVTHALVLPEEPSMDKAFLVAYPALIIASSQLLGSRGAWLMTAVTAVVVPSVVLLRHQAVVGGIPPHYFDALVTFELCLGATAALIGSFFRTIEELLKRERLSGERAKEVAVQREHGERMEAVGQLAGGVAHDVNNLLVAVGGSAEMLRNSSDPLARELSEILAEAASRGAYLTGRLLAFARKDVGKAEEVDVAAVLKNLRPMLQHTLGGSAPLSIEGESGLTVRIDRSQLEQIALHLATNAREAHAEHFEMRVVQVGRTLVVEAEDDGCGIDEKIRNHIFEPFFTTKGKEKSTGLGLSAVHGTVQRWGGTVEFTTRVGKGTTFRLSFPLVVREPRWGEEIPLSGTRLTLGSAAEMTTSAKFSSASSHADDQENVGFNEEANTAPRPHILFVEDDPLARKFISRILEQNGMRFTMASSGDAAWRLWRDGTQADLVLSDVVMPGMSGVELAERIRATHPEVPVLLISGYLSDVVEDGSFDRVKDLLLKPFTPEELMRRVSLKLNERIRSPKVPGRAG